MQPEIIEVPQRSEYWRLLRKGKPTASSFSRIVTSSGELSKQIDDYALELAGEMVAENLPEPYTNNAIERGISLELEAIKLYEYHTFCTVKQVGFVSWESFGASPDGLIEDDGLVEIKCPLWHTHNKYIFKGGLDIKYKQQVQGQLMATQRKWCDLVSYHPDFGERKLFIKRVTRDEEFIKKLKAGIEKVIELRDQYLNEIK